MSDRASAQGKASVGARPIFDISESAQERHWLIGTSSWKVVVYLPIPSLSLARELAAHRDKDMAALYTKNLVSPNTRE